MKYMVLTSLMRRTVIGKGKVHALQSLFIYNSKSEVTEELHIVNGNAFATVKVTVFKLQV